MACHFVEENDSTYQGKISMYFIYMFLLFCLRKFPEIETFSVVAGSAIPAVSIPIFYPCVGGRHVSEMHPLLWAVSCFIRFGSAHLRVVIFLDCNFCKKRSS